MDGASYTYIAWCVLYNIELTIYKLILDWKEMKVQKYIYIYIYLNIYTYKLVLVFKCMQVNRTTIRNIPWLNKVSSFFSFNCKRSLFLFYFFPLCFRKSCHVSHSMIRPSHLIITKSIWPSPLSISSFLSFIVFAIRHSLIHTFCLTCRVLYNKFFF